MIVVTGAAGFIGSNLVADLEAQERGPVAICDWFGSDERWRNIAKRNIAAFVSPEEIIEFLEAHAARIKAVIHLGAMSATTARDVDRLVAFNIRPTVLLWDWCTTRTVPFIYASSAAVYGGREECFIDSDIPSDVAELRPLNPYGWSKKVVDQLFVNRVAYGEPAPPQWVAVRFFNVYGPNEYHKETMRSVVVKLFESVIKGGGIQLFKSHRTGIADGEQRRDFIYVKDCTRAICWFLDHPTTSGIFNLGTGTARSFLEMAAVLSRVLDRKLDVEFFEIPEEIRGQYQYFTQADMTKARNRGLSFTFTSLEEGIADYLERYLLCEDRYR